MDFKPCFKVHNLVSVYPKSLKLGQMTNLNMIFHVVVSVYRLVTISNSPQFPVEFRNGLCCCLRAQFGAPFVPCRGMVSGALIRNFVITLALLFLTLVP